MQTLRIVLLVIFWIDSILLVICILLQSGRGGGLAGALGGISSADSALGVRAASQIEKATGVLAAIFFLIALTLAFMAVHSGKALEKVKTGTRAVTSAPAGVKPSPPAKTSPAATTSAPAAALPKSAGGAGTAKMPTAPAKATP